MNVTEPAQRRELAVMPPTREEEPTARIAALEARLAAVEGARGPPATGGGSSGSGSYSPGRP